MIAFKETSIHAVLTSDIPFKSMFASEDHLNLLRFSSRLKNCELLIRKHLGLSCRQINNDLQFSSADVRSCEIVDLIYSFGVSAAEVGCDEEDICLKFLSGSFSSMNVPEEREESFRGTG